MSEVIMRTRQYMNDIAGGTGNVLTHHKTIQDLEKYFGGMADNKDVKEFLQKVISDKQGWELDFYKYILTFILYDPLLFKFVVSYICSRGRAL